ncbi:hypothetical protein LCGC14_1190440 [marine sediment metagenome]|uniref:Uncharacterized protein n=1 Tax=marine sediment metagenome TaxID=412755 RepID=A0A0F9LJI6_9ZZZZ
MYNLPIQKSRTAGGTSFFLFLVLLFLSGCAKEGIGANGTGPETTAYSLAGARSIFVDSGKLLITGNANRDALFSTRYWADASSIDRSEFVKLVDKGTVFQESVDDSYRTVYSYKDLKGETQKYRFDQGSLFRDGEIFFYKNDSIITLDTMAIGTVSSLSFLDGAPYYTGYFGKIVKTEAGDALSPENPFIWDGGSSLQELPLPSEETFFQGVSNVYINGPNEYYVGSRGSLPMYWKNEELVELGEDAQAYGIFVDGDDVYVSGSIGRIPVEYTPCYWKNGVRVDLPF